MKKTLFAVIILGAVLLLAGCGGDKEYVSPTDASEIDGIVEEDPDKAPDPAALDNETQVADAAALTAAVGVKVAMPADYTIDRYAVIDGNKGQLEFVYNENSIVSRAVKGNDADIFTLGEHSFDNTETVTVSGLTATVKYPTADNGSVEMGIITAYNATTDITYGVSMITGATRDDLVKLLTDLITASGAQ